MERRGEGVSFGGEDRQYLGRAFLGRDGDG
jgi:hypothetical protein